MALIIAGVSLLWVANTIESPQPQLFKCHLNEPPILFLYPAINEDNIFLNNTQYEIILNEEHYMGKFNASRLNHSYLNLTYGDYIEAIVSAESNNNKYVKSEPIYYNIDCQQNNYIFPKLKTYDKNMSFRLINELNYEEISLNSTLELYADYARILIRINYLSAYNHLFCFYDTNKIKEFKFELRKDYAQIDPKIDWNRYPYMEGYPIYEEGDYLLYIEIYPSHTSLTPTTIRCEFADEEYYITNDEYWDNKLIDTKYSLKNGTDIGLPNPTFNITLIL